MMISHRLLERDGSSSTLTMLLFEQVADSSDTRQGILDVRSVRGGLTPPYVATVHQTENIHEAETRVGPTTYMQGKGSLSICTENTHTCSLEDTPQLTF